MKDPETRRAGWLCRLIGVAMCLFMGAGSAAAHAVVYPEQAPTGAYQKYVLRVPNERGFATNRVEILFPVGVRVISFDEIPGWTLETTSTDGGATFSAAAWSGTIGVGRFVEFGFIGVNPAEPTTLKWDVVQTYSDGEVVQWTGPADSSTPASLTSVSPVGGALVSAPQGNAGNLLGAAALLVALISLGLVLRPARSTS